MGSYSHNCKLSGLPITSGEPVVLIPMVHRGKLYENSEESLKKYGSTYQCSNDSVRMKFSPSIFPIKGEYDDYGGIENIIYDENTKVLEEYYDLTIDQIAAIITSGRKNDGFDDALKIIKDPNAENAGDDYGKPVYLERYKDLLTMSGMWIHGDLYDKLVESSNDDGYDKIDLGTPQMLNELGFIEIEEDKTEDRYNRRFKKDNLIVNSDGTWLNIKDHSVYRLVDFIEYCESKGVKLNNSKEINSKDKLEQTIDYLIPTVDRIAPFTPDEIVEEVDRLTKRDNLSEEDAKELSHEMRMDAMGSSFRGGGDITESIRRYLLDRDTRYSEIKNPLTSVYFKAVKEGKLRENIVEFWRFDSYMYSTGKYYSIVGTGPQCGDWEEVHKVLKIATEIAWKNGAKESVLQREYDNMTDEERVIADAKWEEENA